MTEVIRAAAQLQAFCEASGWRYCFIGGLALLARGEPRETIDADLTLLTGFGGEESYVRELLRNYEARNQDPVGFALQNRVLLLKSSGGIGLDIALGALPFEELVVERSTVEPFVEGIKLRVCSAEDLIVMKAFAGRTRDWADIEQTIAKQAGKLDWNHIRLQLGVLTEIRGNPEALTTLEKCRRQFDQE